MAPLFATHVRRLWQCPLMSCLSCLAVPPGGSPSQVQQPLATSQCRALCFSFRFPTRNKSPATHASRTFERHQRSPAGPPWRSSTSGDTRNLQRAPRSRAPEERRIPQTASGRQPGSELTRCVGEQTRPGSRMLPFLCQPITGSPQDAPMSAATANYRNNTNMSSQGQHRRSLMSDDTSSSR